jgi:cyclophilin family peptidyl-prolyl cis-trans isomerase/HEAT repeat protein
VHEEGHVTRGRDGWGRSDRESLARRAGARLGGVAALLALALSGAGCGMHAPSAVKAPPPPGSGIARRPPATTPMPAPDLPAPPAAIARAIAIAEDQRRYADGELRKLLAHANPAVRSRAALAVGRLQDSTTVPDLLPLLADANPAVRREAVFALGQIGHRSARRPLEERLRDADGETVELTIEALSKLGDKAASAPIAAFLRTGTVGQRSEAAVALWRLADSTALNALLSAHSDPDPEVRWRVLYALEKIVMPQRVVLVVALHLNDPDWIVRAYAARTLGRQKSTRGTPYLLGVLGDTETPVVVNGIRALQMIADSTTRGVGRALARALGHADPYVRVTAATALADRFAWGALDSAGRAATMDSVRAHLDDRDAATRGACARVLLGRGRKADRARVAALMAGDLSIYARTAVIAAWPAGDAAPLRQRLEPPTPLFERMSAADRLGELKERSALPRLRAGLADTSALFVASCAGALAALGDTASVPALARAWGARAGDADADARIAIRDALRELAGRPFADSLERKVPARNAQPASYPPDFAEPPRVKGAVLHTTAGDIEWAFYREEAPQTVRNFVRLAERRYFDGLVVHRVVPNFVIQDGDPTGTGSGGPGYTIRCEYNRLRYGRYMVGMALSGKDTGGSQWFITHSPQPHLNGRYTIFAHVVRGMDVVWKIVQGDRVTKVDILK